MGPVLFIIIIAHRDEEAEETIYNYPIEAQQNEAYATTIVTQGNEAYATVTSITLWCDDPLYCTVWQCERIILNYNTIIIPDEQN